METATIEKIKTMSANILCSCGCKTKNYKKKLMGLKFRIFIKAEHNSMSSPAALLRKAKAASSAASAAKPTAPVAAPPATSSAASVASPKAAPKECAEFNRTGNPCSRGKTCRDKRCRDASATSPKTAVKGGDGGVSSQLAAMQKKLDQIEVKIDSGFEAQQQRSLALQEQGSKAYADTMQMFKAFGSMITGGFTAITTTQRDLMAPPIRPAICTSSRSIVTEVIERSGARGGGSSAPEAPEASESGMTGADMDSMMMICSNQGFSTEGYVYRVLCSLFGKNTVTDHHKMLLSSIAGQTKNDALAAFFFLLLSGSGFSFAKASLDDLNGECKSLLSVPHLAKTRETFSSVCEAMIKKYKKWEIKKKDDVKASNADLLNKAKHNEVFDALVKNLLK
jgi:hypothetical protein